jgi:hypothetical protein
MNDGVLSVGQRRLKDRFLETEGHRRWPAIMTVELSEKRRLVLDRRKGVICRRGSGDSGHF